MTQFQQNYMNRMVETIKRINPQYNDEQIIKVVNRLIKSQGQNPVAILQSDIREDITSNLLDVFEYIDNKRPIVSGNGVLFKRHDQELAPTVTMMIDLKNRRKFEKKEMFKYSPDSPEYRMWNQRQLNTKANNLNAFYGILAVKSCAIFNEYCPGAVTATARLLISTTLNTCEGLIGNNVTIFHINDLFDYLNCIIRNHKDDNIDDIPIPSDDDIIYRLSKSFYNYTPGIKDIIEKFIKNLNRHDKTFIGYANNLNEFLNLPICREKILSIFEKLPHDLDFNNIDIDKWKKYNPNKKMESIKDYRKMVATQLFYDPYNIPDCIKKEISDLTNLVEKYVFVKHLVCDAEARALALQRNCVVVMDTDSNMLYCAEYKELINNMINKDYGRTSKDNNVIAINILMSIVSKLIDKIVRYALELKNVSPEYQLHMTFKNEFYYGKMLISNVKKRYTGNIIVREGNYLDKYKVDMKGFDFKKSNVPVSVEQRFMKIIKEKIFESDDINNMDQNIIDEVQKFEKEIVDSIKNGDKSYYKLSTFKEADAFKFPERMPQWNGSMLWNMKYPDKKIEPMDKIYIVNINPSKLEIPKEYTSDKRNVICIPSTCKDIPLEILNAVDADMIAAGLISTFGSILDIFGIVRYKYKSSDKSRKYEKVTNIIEI